MAAGIGAEEGWRLRVARLEGNQVSAAEGIERCTAPIFWPIDVPTAIACLDKDDQPCFITARIPNAAEPH